MISRADFNAYNNDVEKLVKQARQQTVWQVEAWIRINPDASVAECREMAKETMSGMVQAYGEASATLAAKWYDKQAQKAHVKLPEAITETTYSKETIEKVAHYQAKKLINGDISGFAKSCGELVENEMKQSLNETILANTKRDKQKGVRFARVTTGAETCAFCYMLASRGAVYHTRRTAGEQSHYHRGCDCKIVPGFEDDRFAEIVEGYDPEGMYDRMSLIEKQTGLRFSNKKDLSALSKEMKLRDKQWLIDGTIPKPRYESEAVREFKYKNKQSTKQHEVELETAKLLTESGFDVTFVIDEIIDQQTGATIGLADLRSGLEIKTLRDATSENTINSHLKNASKKRNITAVIFDNSSNKLKDEVLIQMLLNSIRFKGKPVYIINKSKQVQKIR